MISAIDALPSKQPFVVQQKQMIYREAVGQGPLSAEVQTVCVTPHNWSMEAADSSL